MRMSQQAHQYVYLLQAGDFVKVGRSSEIRKRISLLQTGCPTKIEPVVAYGPIDARDACVVEGDIQHFMKKTQTHGEWFECGIEAAISAFAARVCIDVRHHIMVFEKHCELVVFCFKRERIVRNNRSADAAAFEKDIDSVLSVFMEGHSSRAALSTTA